MARIRSLKPEFFTDSTIVQLSPYARLLYQGMWCHADEAGVLEDDALQLKMRILPADPVDAEGLVDELVKSRRVRRAAAPNGTRVLVVTKFAEHQRVDSRLEPRWGRPDTFDYTDEFEHVGTCPDMSTPSMGQGSGVVGQGSGVTGDSADADAAPTRTRQTRATQLPDEWEPTDQHREIAAEKSLNLAEEVVKFRDWAASKGATKKDWNATFRNWLRNDQYRPVRNRGRPAVSTHDEAMEANRNNPDYWTRRHGT